MPPNEGHKITIGWRRVSLGDICGITAKQVDPRIAEFGALPHVNGTSIESGTCRLLHLETASNAGLISGKYLFDAGDVLYSKLRPYLRKVVVAENRGVCSADMYPIRVIREMVDPRFLAWLLVTDEFTRYAIEESARARMPKLNREQLFAWETALPPIDEQHRILAVLEGQMAAVERARAAAEAQLEAAASVSAAYLRKVFASAEAQSWERKRIRAIAECCSGATPARHRAEYFGGTIPWVKTGELRDDLIERTEEYVTEAALRETSLRLLPARTLLVAMYGQGQTRGRTGLLAAPATTNQACFAILPNPSEFEPAYLQLWFRYSYLRIRGHSEGRGGNQPNLSGVLLGSEEVPLPPIEQQRRVVDILKTGMGGGELLRKAVSQKIEVIGALPGVLLRRAFSGEV